MNNLSVHEHSTWSRKEQNTRRHVGVVTWSLGYVAELLLQLALVHLVGWFTGGHLRWENTWCNGVDTDLGLGEGASHHAGEMDHSCLGRTVGELSAAGALHETRDRGDVDDRWGVALDRGTTLAEKWEDVCGEEEVSGDVGVEGILPCGPLRPEHVLGDGVWGGPVWRVVLELGGILESDTCIVDKEVDATWLILGDLVDEGLYLGLVGYITSHSVTVCQCQERTRYQGHLRHDLSTLRILLGDGVKSILASASDVDLRSVGDEGLGNHQSDAGSSTGHDCSEATHAEELVDLQVGIGGSLVLGCCGSHGSGDAR